VGKPEIRFLSDPRTKPQQGDSERKTGYEERMDEGEDQESVQASADTGGEPIQFGSS
jgi:hypothetical protein